MSYDNIITILSTVITFVFGFELVAWVAERRIVQKARSGTRLAMHGRLYEVREYRANEERHP